jgi:hypothetical protein
MPEVRPANPDAGKALPPDVSRSVAALTRALVAAARSSAQARGDVPHAVVGRGS